MTATVSAADIAEQDVGAIIDVRERDEFVREQISGSQNIPLAELSGAVGRLHAMTRVILSCQSGNRARQAYDALQAMGVQNLSVLEGGLNGWKSGGRSTVSFKSGVSIMRQVQIIVGVMVLTGVFFKPLWLLAPIAGAGMLVAGLTNTCMMAVLLGKMPWNRASAPNTQACALRPPAGG